MKRCFRCDRILQIDQFYKHPRTKDGRSNKCKDCTKSEVRQNRRKKIEYYRQYDRQRGSRQTHEYHKDLRERRPEAYRARYAVSNAIRDGRLTKKRECEHCGDSGYIHGHHDDYSKPLDVIWLCVPCHKNRHKELGWGYVWNLGMDMAG